MIRFYARRWQQVELAQRLCQLIYGTADVWRPSPDRLQIGSANDWWLHPKGGEEYLLHYRYADLERMQHLAVVLEWFLGAEIIEVS